MNTVGIFSSSFYEYTIGSNKLANGNTRNRGLYHKTVVVTLPVSSTRLKVP